MQKKRNKVFVFKGFNYFFNRRNIVLFQKPEKTFLYDSFLKNLVKLTPKPVSFSALKKGRFSP